MTTKICSKCKIEKNFCEFYKNPKKENKVRSTCKKCMNKKSYDYSQKNKNKIKEIKDKYVSKNKTKVLESKKEWFNKNPNYKKEHYLNKKDYYLEKKKEYYESNREKIIEKNKKYAKDNKELINKKNTIKYQNNPLVKIKVSLRSRLRIFLTTKSFSKKNKTFDIVGCTPKVLKEHIEKQFVEGMSWDNYGFYGWHIDHIIPLYYAKTEEDMYKLCHYTNLQPLWAKDNWRKNKKLIFPS